MADITLIDKVKTALRLSTSAYDEAELIPLIEAAKLDLKLVSVDEKTDALYERAVITYCRAHFGSPSDYPRLKASYDEQKAQLMVATGYTEWGD